MYAHMETDIGKGRWFSGHGLPDGELKGIRTSPSLGTVRTGMCPVLQKRRTWQTDD